MPRTELLTAAMEAGQSLKRLATMAAEELKAQRDRHEEEPIHAAGDEKYEMYICTRTPTLHYFTPEGRKQVLGFTPGCPVPHCEGGLRQVEMVIVNP